jgi:four helix bundle protein
LKASQNFLEAKKENRSMSFQTTRIYQRALELVAAAKEVQDALPPGHGYLTDQLRRAASSVLLNFAEGYHKPSRREQRRFFAIAIGSANEVAAVIDVARALEVIEPGAHQRVGDLCDHLARMLTLFRR